MTHRYSVLGDKLLKTKKKNMKVIRQDSTDVGIKPSIISRWPSNWRIKGYPPDESGEESKVEEQTDTKIDSSIHSFLRKLSKKLVLRTCEVEHYHDH